MQDEYKHYLQRFKAGDTLAQRWQRLRENGKWDEVKEEWEEWQSDILLQELQASNAASRSTRGRGRGRKDADELMETDDLGPRRVSLSIMLFCTPACCAPAHAPVTVEAINILGCMDASNDNEWCSGHQ